MQVRSGHPASATHLSQHIAAAHSLSGVGKKSGKVRIVRFHALPMIDDQQPSITAVPLRKDHDAIPGGVYRRSGGSQDIDSRMKLAFPREGIVTLSKPPP